MSDFLVVPSQQNAISHVTWVVQQKRGWGLGMRLWIGQLVNRARGCMTWCYFIGLFSIKTVDSAQPRNCSVVTRPLSSWEGGVWARDCSWRAWPRSLIASHSSLYWMPFLQGAVVRWLLHTHTHTQLHSCKVSNVIIRLVCFASSNTTMSTDIQFSDACKIFFLILLNCYTIVFWPDLTVASFPGSQKQQQQKNGESLGTRLR